MDLETKLSETQREVVEGGMYHANFNCLAFCSGNVCHQLVILSGQYQF